jgi:hypothetical protein
VTEEVEAVPAAKRTLKQRLQAHFAEYGRIAIWTYLSLSLLAIIGFSIAIGVGFGASSTSGVLGVIGAGWVAAKATVPLRILATLGLTPLIATLVRRRKRAAPAEDDSSPADDGTASQDAAE